MSNLELNDAEKAKIAEADALEAKANAMRQEAFDARKARDVERPVIDRLCFAAYDRCPCGYGMAYDPTGEVASNKDSPLRTPSQWECAGILMGTADPKVTHQSPLPFAFWEVKSENQPSARGATTREFQAPAASAGG